MKRKFLIIFFMGVLIIGLTGCGKKDNSSDENVTKVGKLDLEVEDISSFSDGLARIKVDGKYGYIDKLGNTVIEPMYDKAESFSDGLALVCTEGTKEEYSTNYNCGYIDTKGEVVIDLKYENGESFVDGITVVKSGLYGIVIDKNGNELYSNDIYYASTTVLNDGLLMVSAIDVGLPKEYNGQYTIIDSNNEFKSILTKGIAGTTGCANNLCSIRQLYDDNGNIIRTGGNLGGKYGYVDYQGNLVIDYKFDVANKFTNGLAAVSIDNKLGYINTKGEYVIDLVYPDNFWIYPSLNDGLLLLYNDDGEVIAFNGDGKEVYKLDSNYSYGNYSEGFVVVGKKDDDKKTYVYLDKSGKQVFGPYESASDFSEGLAFVEISDNEFAFINNKGKTIIGGSIVTSSGTQKTTSNTDESSSTKSSKDSKTNNTSSNSSSSSTSSTNKTNSNSNSNSSNSSLKSEGIKIDNKTMKYGTYNGSDAAEGITLKLNSDGTCTYNGQNCTYTIGTHDFAQDSSTKGSYKDCIIINADYTYYYYPINETNLTDGGIYNFIYSDN